MTTIFQLCCQSATSFIRSNATLAELADLAREQKVDGTSRKLFLFSDPAARAAALAIPELVIAAIELLRVPDSTPAGTVGLYSVLGLNQVVVHQSVEAAAVFRMVRDTTVDVIIAVDDGYKPTGYVVQSWLRERLPYADMIANQSSEDLRAAIGDVSGGKGDLAEAIDCIAGEHPSFHSEGINQLAARPYICPGPLSHPIDQLPCYRHPSATATRRDVTG